MKGAFGNGKAGKPKPGLFKKGSFGNGKAGKPKPGLFKKGSFGNGKKAKSMSMPKMPMGMDSKGYH